MNRLPTSPLIAKGLELAERHFGMERLSIKLGAAATTIHAWRAGDVTMPEEKFLELVDILTVIDPDWTDKVKRPARSGGPIRVVVVDDHRDNVDTMLALLRVHQFDAKGCYDSLQALDCVVEHDPDAVILDLRMPGKSGVEVARDIRERIPGKRPVLIALTAEYTKNSERLLPGMVDFDHVLVKPAEIKVLVGLLQKARSPV